MRAVLIWAALGGVLIAALRLLEYQHVVRSYPGEAYGGLVAVLFTVVGAWMGLKWRRAQERIVVREVRVPPDAPFAVDADAVRRIGVTPRELEILALIAEGLSTKEIAGRVLVSENTVKTHAARLYGKLGVARRTQAVQEGRRIGLIP